MKVQEYPISTVGALILNEEGEVLLLKTHKWRGKYGLPGGKIEVGEGLEVALVREIKEETNLEVSEVGFLLFQEVIFSEEFYKKVHFIFFNYVCRAGSVEELRLNDEAESYVWVGLEESLGLELNEPTYLLIKYYLERNKVGRFNGSVSNGQC